MQQAQIPPPLTFEQVMAIMDKQFIEQRTDMLIKFEEERKLRMAELDKQFAKRDEEFAKYEALRKAEMEKFVKEMGHLANRFGEAIEYLIAPDICEKFVKFGFTFKTATFRQQISDGQKIITEIDILLEDTGSMMAIETKTKPTEWDVNRHLRRLNQILQYPIRAVRGTKLYGAIAGAVVTDDVRELAFKEGLYVISQTSDNVKVEQPPEYFVAKWLSIK